MCAGLPVVAHADTSWYPGLLLSAEPIGREWGGLDDVQRIGYVTTGPGGKLIAAEALVRVPDGPAPDGGYRIVAWDHGTSGVGQQCGLTGSPQLEEETGPIVRRLNDAGYAVVAPDYIGLSPGSPVPHPYLQTSTAASATIDAVRATRAAVGGLSTSWGVTGFSQGGHAALGAGRYAPEYAPELDFRGTVALAPVSNMEHIFLRSRPDQLELPGFAGRAVTLVLSGMVGAGLDIDDYLTPAGRDFVGELRTSCNSGTGRMLAEAQIGNMLTRPLNDPEFAPMMRDYMGVPVSGYQDPILVVHGVYDAVVPLPLTLALTGQFLLNGTQHQLRILEAGHNVLQQGGLDHALDFFARELPPG
ncbi:alpha/beta fold hydrolase [Nocardia flavorosea]|uniref:Alpha/beta fold hydrolase n=1 Tax=Nocardia flavorosea TaxID=53429 RepID=A0A846Y9F2_9NOCA|nr:alpha/beta fold hydrolase [Nocardia flavorosea]